MSRRTDDLERQASWARYVQRMAHGDHRALGVLFDESGPLVLGLAVRMLGRREDAEEVTADVYVHVWRNAGSFDAERGTVAAWLLTLARSRTIDCLRRRAAAGRLRERLEDRAERPGCSATPEEALAAARRGEQVRRALASLPPPEREAIGLAYFSGLTHSELAHALGQPLGTVKTRIRRGLSRLREQLSPLAACG